jgi:hypothetical protein
MPPGLRARDARLNGQPVSLIEGPPPRVLLVRTGRSVLTLDTSCHSPSQPVQSRLRCRRRRHRSREDKSAGRRREIRPVTCSTNSNVTWLPIDRDDHPHRTD